MVHIFSLYINGLKGCEGEIEKNKNEWVWTVFYFLLG